MELQVISGVTVHGKYVLLPPAKKEITGFRVNMFVSLLVCLSAGLFINFLADFDEIFVWVGVA